jgi:hypothetical protein
VSETVYTPTLSEECKMRTSTSDGISALLLPGARRVVDTTAEEEFRVPRGVVPVVTSRDTSNCCLRQSH